MRETQYLFVFNGLTERQAVAPAAATTSTFGAATWPIAWEAVCAGSGGLGWFWPAQQWPTSDGLANRWQIPSLCEPTHTSCVCPNTQFNGWPCDQGHTALPMAGNKRVGFADAVAVHTANNAGPDQLSAWFPGVGERIYQNPPSCPADGTLDW